ncbi:MAG: hypothetical protein HY886_08215 [Deltaproteobacteria bacterium]|nr:hypothetical protein [Deltaproteobacteria bacterium]
MKRLFHKAWAIIGSAIIIVITCCLIAVVRIIKALVVERKRPVALFKAEADVFHDSRKQPLPPNLKTQG